MDAPPDLEQLLQRYATGHYRPATFLERGVTLPLTTPALLGARIRPAARKGLELVLPNPSGAEGVYILPWSALHDFCAPSLHDRMLWERVSALPLLSPGTVREAARQVAAAGYAGRAAARAAGAAAAARQDGTARTQYGLLLMLIRQGEPPGGYLPPEQDSPVNIQLRVRAVLKRRAGQIHPGRALEVVEEAAAALAGIGLRGEHGAPLARLVQELGALAQAIASWAAARPPGERPSAELIVAATELTLRCAERSIAEAQALTEDIWTLLTRWDRDAERIRALAARPDWLLDGWELLSGVWNAAGPEGRRMALTEMALLVPVIPSEARDWLGFDAEGDMEHHRSGLRTWRRTVLARQDWVTGRMANLPQERNEALREAYA